MRKFRQALIIFALIYLLLSLLLFIFQREILYFPTDKIDHNHQSQFFNNDDELIEVIILNKGKQKGILFFGGNSETVVKSADEHITNFPDYTVYLVNYRGYGGSSGVPEEQAIYSDALHIYDEIKNDHKSISVIGRSLGTGVATYVSSKRNVEKMILIAPYESIENIAKFRYPIFPVSLLLMDKFDSLSRINKIKAKTLVILAENDTVIPYINSMRLINAFPPSQITMVMIEGIGHNNFSEKNEFHSLVRDFMQ